MRRLGYIDSIRGLAALAVIYAHAVESGLRAQLGPSPFERSVLALLTEHLDIGKIAVTLFFAVSGFVVPTSLLKPGRRPIAAFAVSRFFRLYPAYWLSIAFGVVVLFLWAGRDVPPLLVPANITMLQQFFGVENIIGLYWTLQIELIFYCLCAVIFALGRLEDRRSVVACALGLIGVAIGLAYLRFAFERRFPVAVPLSLAIMIWGLCLRYRYAEGRQDWAPALRLVTIALVGAIPVIAWLAYGRDMGFHESWTKYTTTYLLAMALFHLLTQRVRLNGAVFVRLGAISYSIYLFGPVMQAVAEHLVAPYAAVVPVHALALATALVTIAFAALVYRTVEAPAIALGRRVGDSLDGGRRSSRDDAQGRGERTRAGGFTTAFPPPTSGVPATNERR